jgi:phosphoribosylformimino-5-aminoimidazole carboxamide ribotide isomerase
MEIIPAIDISDGKCVRLFQGIKGTETIYYEDPLDALEYWKEIGAERLHFIDLDGAWGSNKNKQILREMIQDTERRMKVQVGGGIRTIEEAEELVDLGVDRVIIGTMAIKTPEKIKILSKKIGSEHVIVALDYKNGRVATHGWTKQTNKDPFSFGKKIGEYGAGFILFSAIESDGAFTGPDFINIKKMVNSIDIPILAAGGIRNEEDLEKLHQIGVHGAVIGKAFYEKKIDPLIVKKSKFKNKRI